MDVKSRDLSRHSLQNASHKLMNSPESIGSVSGLAPDFRNISVSTIPGCTLATKMFGFSAARNSNVFTAASFEVKYPESPGVPTGGKTRAPAVTPSIDACVLLATGRKAVAAMMIDFTLVCVRVFFSLMRISSRSIVKGDGEADLVGTPVVGETGGCNRGRVGYVAGVQDEYVPDANISSDFMHCLVIRDISGVNQAENTAAVCLY